MLLLTSEVNDGELLPSLEALKHKQTPLLKFSKFD